MDLTEIQLPSQPSNNDHVNISKQHLSFTEDKSYEIEQSQFSLPLNITQFDSMNVNMNLSSKLPNNSLKQLQDNQLNENDSNLIPEASRKAYEKAYIS